MLNEKYEVLHALIKDAKAIYCDGNISNLGTYEFDSEVEWAAFVRGLEAMCGWNDYRHIEDLEADDYERMRDENPELYKGVCALTGMKLCNDCCGLFHKSEFDDEGLCPDCQEEEEEEEKSWCPSCKMDMHFDEIGNCKGCGNSIDGGAV
ncbi:hypothetical protein E0765_07185 [Sulfuricurvum sp. IAE1]|uniref:hypothetical protein n=1 Tax=Sulfuricurvum sp. IAE1 TaxID=2546102 RepID=UPI001050D318|nr:hypothetical protein [Sulfuricurvum sp. IAE1]TDA63611.1 hypothetical protein E0765_07185 [Sulfuricurvum sp. IAE1]